jgi:hypothetical protein
MNQSLVLAKTAKGLDELKSRTHGLPQKLRSLLIVVDGAATAGELMERFASLADVEANLQTLIDQGFIEGKARPAPPKDATPRAPQETREEALSHLTHVLHEAMGPAADPLAMRLESAVDAAAFAAAAERAADALATFGGAQRARQFRERAKSYSERFFAAV